MSMGLVYMLTGSSAGTIARVCAWNVQLSSLSPAVASFCSMGTQCHPVWCEPHSAFFMIGPLSKELKTLQEKKCI